MRVSEMQTQWRSNYGRRDLGATLMRRPLDGASLTVRALHRKIRTSPSDTRGSPWSGMRDRPNLGEALQRSLVYRFLFQILGSGLWDYRELLDAFAEVL